MATSKKRPREVKATDTQLIEIYDDLANEDEAIRLKAAYALLSQFSTGTTTIEQHKTILKRLFRGLCSGRKAARLGFSVALTEFLSQVFLPYIDDHKIEASEIIDLLESQTAVEGKTSGQDERDHYFGRLFGAEALVKSSVLFSSSLGTFSQWERLLDFICGIALKKPWLREQCGWLLSGCVKTLPEDFNRCLVLTLARHKLLRTPEGIAIWLSQEDTSGRGLHMHKLWKHDGPLSKKGVSTLANIMKDAKPQQGESDSDMDSQGKAMWSPQLHFAWDLLLRELYQEATDGRVSFKDFWLQVVDQSLFASSSSAERRHWGLLLLAKVFAEAPENAIGHVMTPNVVACLQNQLKADSRYLQRSAQKAIQAMHARVTKTPTIALAILRGMLADAGALQFDVVTKTKTIEKLVTANDDGSICDFLGELFQKPGVGNGNEITHARKIITDLLANTCMHTLGADQRLQESISDTDAVERSPLMQSRHIIEILVHIAFFVQPADPEVTPASRQYVRERIMACLEQALKTKAMGRALLQHTITSVTRFQSQGLQPTFDFDDSIKAIMRGARRRLGIFEKRELPGNDVHSTNGNGAIDGIILLYHLAQLQVYSGEPEAVTILEDLNEYHDKLTRDDDSFMGSDVLVEVLLSFASKPSKFLRKISLQAFGSFAAQISQEGLQSLIRVLETKENLQGQGEVFDVEESEDDAVNGINGSNSDIEVDSDVEEISDRGGRSSDESSETDADGEDRESAEDEDNDQLAAFDAMLAAALGTRKGEDDLAASDTSGSDDDMADSEMEALDEKLTEVFRARKDLAKPKKKERKDAKENIVNFKNRVLDLIDIYLKQEYANSLSLQLVLPLLVLARRTNVKQLADRACGILRDFNGRCRGAKLPQLADPEATLNILRAVHDEAGRPGSNAHATACSSASILLVRILSNNGVRAGVLTHLYADTMAKMLEDKNCHVQPAFFTDWNNWCANARKAMTK